MLTIAFCSCSNIPSIMPNVVDKANVNKGHQALFRVNPARVIEVPSATAATPLCKEILMHNINVNSKSSLIPAATPSNTECKHKAKLRAMAELLLISFARSTVV